MLGTNFPAELQQTPHWIVWKHEDVSGRKTKVPYCTTTGNRASTTDSTTWTTYENSLDALNGFDDYSGLGFVFKPPYIGVDLDKCRNAETGVTEPWAEEIIRMLDSYTELSPSKTGYHILLKGTLPQGGNRKGPVEVYTQGRYFTITGEHVPGTPTTINDTDLTEFHSKFILTGASEAPKDESLSAVEWKLACDIAKRLGPSATIEDVTLEFFKNATLRDKWIKNKSYISRTISKAIQKVHPAVTAVDVVEDEQEPEIVQEPLPEFPMIPGTIGELADAICADIPYQFKAGAALTRIGLMLSGRTRLANNKYLQPRFYTCMIATPGTGKTAALKEVSRFLPLGFRTVRSVDSGAALVKLFKETNEKSAGEPARILHAPDEIRDIFEKGRISSSSKNSHFTLITELYSDNYAESNTVGRGGHEVSNAHLALLGGTQPDVYETLWTSTGGSGSGLQSRFILIAADSHMPSNQAAWDEAEAQEIATRIYRQVDNAPAWVRVSDDGLEMLKEWEASLPKTSGDKDPTKRLADIVKQFLVVLAVTNPSDAGPDEPLVIKPWLVRVGIEFGNYVLKLRERFNPEDSSTVVQAACDKIEATLKKHGPMTFRDLKKMVNAKRLKGGYETFDRALKVMERVQSIGIVSKNRQGKERWGCLN